VKEIIYHSLCSSLSIFRVGSYTFSLTKYVLLMPLSLQMLKGIFCRVE